MQGGLQDRQITLISSAVSFNALLKVQQLNVKSNSRAIALFNDMPTSTVPLTNATLTSC